MDFEKGGLEMSGTHALAPSWPTWISFFLCGGSSCLHLQGTLDASEEGQA